MMSRTMTLGIVLCAIRGGKNDRQNNDWVMNQGGTDSVPDAFSGVCPGIVSLECDQHSQAELDGTSCTILEE